MDLSHKERLRRALFHEPVDRIPTQINYTGSMSEKLATGLDISVEDLPLRLDNHLVRVDLDHTPVVSEDGGTYYDWWGVGFSTKEEGYFTTDNPLAENDDLDSFHWPDPNRPNLLDHAASVVQLKGDGYFITPNFGFALFERAWSLRGLDHFLMDMALDPTWCHELFDHITEIQLILIQRFIELGVDGGYFGDDYGSQKNLLFSPKMWRQMIKPRLARLFEPFRTRGLPVILHSDGNIAEIIPDLIEIGLTTLNPVQPEVLDHRWLNTAFGEQLSFYGGISTQTVLPHGRPSDIKAAVYETVDRLAPKGTGLLLAPSHRMMIDIPIENVEAMIEGFAQLGENR